MGLNVAMWTVDTKANYLKYGNMGVYMMTCNSLKPSEMPELDDINWGEDGLDESSCDAVCVNATDWYTVGGMRVGPNGSHDGIYISVKHLSDGSIQADKVIKPADSNQRF